MQASGKTALKNYILRHWRGEAPLAQAFWINFLLLFSVLEAMEPLVWPPYVENEVVVAGAVYAFITITKLLIYPWQLVGVLRACGKRIQRGSGRLPAMVAQAAMAGSLVIAVVLALDSYHVLQVYHERQAFLRRPPDEPSYKLALVAQNSLIHLSGPFEVGITKRVTDLLRQNPGVKGIILDSDGGQIYEGRGLAFLIRDNGLDTYSLQHCLSSCTTAYIAGVERILGENAKLGFHQYKTHSIIPSVNVPNEQERDMEIFKAQGVAAEFLDKIFERPPESMWWPDVDELVSAGVVHRTGFKLSEDLAPD